MDYGKVIFGLLSDSVAVQSIVGSDPVRVYPIAIPQQSAFPAIRYELVSATPTYTNGTTASKVDRFRVSLHLVGADHGELMTLVQHVRNALHGQQNQVSDSYTIERIYLMDMQDGLWDEDLRTHRVILDFLMRVKGNVTNVTVSFVSPVADATLELSSTSSVRIEASGSGFVSAIVEARFFVNGSLLHTDFVDTVYDLGINQVGDYSVKVVLVDAVGNMGEGTVDFSVI